MTIKQSTVLLARIALFVMYFWFGLLKVIGQSPASPLVEKLFNSTISGIMPFSSFIVLFGLFEMIIGILFFIPRFEKVATGLFGLHIFTTVLPLFVIGEIWTKFGVPTIEGQYIIKNLALVVCAMNIWMAGTEQQKPRSSDSILNTI
jgi:uncharacterized membrane protein YkgB